MPEVTDYKYLGVVLASDCGWAAHAQYVLAKASKTVHALGAVLHNKRVSTVVRRVVLQAVLRPVVEFGSLAPFGCRLLRTWPSWSRCKLQSYAAWSRVAVTWQMTS